jgi:pimeloyl-ACP methyl ester carboxylesterase/DNA-binding CsgD family transcriptional regulator
MKIADKKPEALSSRNVMFSELIELTYATIGELEKFHDLIELWEKCLTAYAGAEDSEILDEEMSPHFNSALQIFDRIGRVQQDYYRSQKMLEFFSVPALICDASMKLIQSNESLDDWMGDEKNLKQLMDYAIAEQIDNWEVDQSIAFVSQPSKTKGMRTAIITELPEMFQDMPGGGRFFLIVFNEIPKDDGVWSLIRKQHGLTEAETDVLVQITQGHKADEIAVNRDVSINTIRAHVRGLLEKTGSRSQNDLIRSSIFLFSQFQSLKLTTQSLQRTDPGLSIGASRVLLPSGRMLHFCQFGAPDGLPVLYLHGMMSGPDLPEHVKILAKKNNLRILAPSRPGFGKSDTIPATEMEMVRQSCRDLMTFLDALSIPAAFVIGNLSAAGIAINFADRFPKRCIGVINSGYAALLNDAFIDNMTTLSRTFARTYQKSKTGIRFLTRAAIASVDFLGADRMIRRHYEPSPVDVEYCEKIGCFDLMANGLSHAIAQGGDAFIKDGYLSVTDWGDTIAQLEGRVPIACLLGSQDEIAPNRFILEKAKAIPNYTVREYPDAGQLVLFQEWPAVVELIHAAFADYDKRKLIEKSADL